MENETAETKTQPATEPTPAPAPTAVAEKPTTEAAKAPAAETQKPGQSDSPKKPGEFFFKQREEKREKKATERVAELEKELEAMRSKFQTEKAAPQSQPAQQQPEVPSFLDDPEKWSAHQKEEAKKAALQAVEEREAEKQRQAAYVQSTDQARSLLLTRSHLKEDPNAASEIAAILEQKYDRLAQYDGGADPMNAAKLAYLEWCQQKGVVPDLDGLPKGAMNMTGGKASSGVPPTAPGTGKRVFAPGEVKKYLNEVQAGTPEWQRRLDETEEAYREGRVQR